MIGTHILGFCVSQLNVGAKLTSFFKCREVEHIESGGRDGVVMIGQKVVELMLLIHSKVTFRRYFNILPFEEQIQKCSLMF